VLYVRRRVLYVDHLVFAAHFQAALYLAFAAAWLMLRLLDLSLAVVMLTQFAVFLVMMTAYLGTALRRVYGESRVMTIAKTVVMLFAYLYTLQAALGPAMIFVIAQI
jgi:hypothetical protein